MSTSVKEERKPFNIDQLARWVTIWHADAVSNMLAAIEVPDTTPVVVTIPEGSEPRTLTGDERAAFLGGISYALTLLGPLPFEATEVTVDEPKPAD